MAAATLEDYPSSKPLPDNLAASLDAPSREFELRVYVCDDGAQVRFISDGGDVEAFAELFDIALFSTQDEADRVAAACATFLADAGMSAAESGWHRVPGDKHRTFIPTLLSVARKQAWSVPWTAPPAPPPAIPPPLHGPDGSSDELRTPRRWSRHKEARFAFKLGQGMSAKQVAADPEIRSTPDACYQRASELGLSFREVPTGHGSYRLPLSHLTVFERAAAAKHMTRDAFIEAWMKRAAADPGRFGLVAI